DTSIFAVNAVCRLMRQHVTVALSGDGGDEAFSGYNQYWQIARIVQGQRLPRLLWQGAPLILCPLTRFGIVPDHLAQRFKDLIDADDAAILQSLFCWVRESAHADLCRDLKLLPVRRLFEPRWDYNFPSKVSRLERLSAHTAEIHVRMSLANDFLF